MRKSLLLFFVTAGVTMVLTTIFQPLSYLPTFAQQQSCRVFQETHRAVCGKFLTYWEQHGGLAQFGYPITNVFTGVSDLNSKEYAVQYFERAAFELHPENKPPYDVLLAQVGTSLYKERYGRGNPEGDYPLYPSAQTVSIERTGELGNTATFQTLDNPQAVLAFYKDTLKRTGWVLDQEQNNNLHFSYEPTLTKAFPNQYIVAANYEINVDIVSVSRGQTYVKVQLINDYPK